jgi:simple sugar transport system ATP-binding protein
VLTPNEADEVLGRLRQMALASEISVLIITHKFREVVSFADEITVLRRGRVSGRGKVRDTTPAAMAEMMVGASPSSEPPPSRTTVVGAPKLRVDQLTADDELGAPALHGITFDVRPGEILGVAAVAGNGQEELVEVLAGQRPSTGGTVWLHDRAFQPSRAAIRRHKLRCLPEEPLANACVATMTVAENLAFRDFDEAPYAAAKLVSRPQLARRAEAAIAEYGVRTRSPDTPIGELSGGNVQRVVLARELSAGVEVLVVANPCMGLDFRAVEDIHRRLRAARDAGAAILLVSADLDEIFALADRIVVLSAGKVVHETTAAAADLRLIGARMAGHA